MAHYRPHTFIAQIIPDHSKQNSTMYTLHYKISLFLVIVKSHKSKTDMFLVFSPLYLNPKFVTRDFSTISIIKLTFYKGLEIK